MLTISRESGSRIEWVDTAKGIGIILVIVAHTSLDYSWVGKFINSFHMPLFFFLSGYFFIPNKFTSFLALIKQKSRTLLLPYIIFALFSYLFFMIRYGYGNPDYFKDLSLFHEFLGVFYSAGTREWMDFNLPLWFLTCMFIVEILFYWIGKTFTGKPQIAFILIACSVIGYLDGVFNPYKLPWGIDVALTAVVFYGLGYLLKTPYNLLLSKSALVKVLLICLFLIANIALLHNRMNLNMKLHGAYYDFYIGALSGITYTILLSSLIRSQILIYLGKNALILMALHIPLLNLVTKLTSSIAGDLGEIVKVVLTLILLVPFIYLINTYMPFILGKKGNKTKRRALLPSDTGYGRGDYAAKKLHIQGEHE